LGIQGEAEVEVIETTGATATPKAVDDGSLVTVLIGTMIEDSTADQRSLTTTRTEEEEAMGRVATALEAVAAAATAATDSRVMEAGPPRPGPSVALRISSPSRLEVLWGAPSSLQVPREAPRSSEEPREAPRMAWPPRASSPSPHSPRTPSSPRHPP